VAPKAEEPAISHWLNDAKSENEADQLRKCSTVELRPELAGTAGFEPATSRLTVEVSQSFTPLLVTVEARTNCYT